MNNKAPIIIVQSGISVIDSLIDTAQRLADSIDPTNADSAKEQLETIVGQAVSLKHLQNGLLELLESQYPPAARTPSEPSRTKPTPPAKAAVPMAANYSRMEVSKDVFAYVENRAGRAQNVKRYFCEPCFKSDRISEMKFDHSEFYIDTYECPNCGSTICINNESQPQDQAAHYGWDWDDYWG